MNSISQELAKRAEKAQEEGKELDEELEEANSQVETLKRIVEVEEMNASKRQKLSSVEERIAELQRSLKKTKDDGSSNNQSMPVPGTGRFGDQMPMTPSSGEKGKQTNGLQTLHEGDDIPLVQRSKTGRDISTGKPNPAPANQQTKEDQVTGNQTKALNHTHGVWSEKTARDMLGNNIDFPLIQTVLNYFESFMSEKMLDELAETLRKTPTARGSLRKLRKAWGGDKHDYFLECTKWTKTRCATRTLSWNKYYQNGYLVYTHGGPTSANRNIPIAEYRKAHKSPLFGHAVSLHMANSDTDRANLSKLYRSYLQTELAGSSPCYAHVAGLLGSEDKCLRCGTRGSLNDLN
ncbi:Tropomyosin beta chain-like [Lasiodiplodia theobromae]|uniref:Tropomyosin beta chain-like n=1 Tax=Lasiodiplodia theobromae TaxID=45133 RepID=UPI0015C3BFC7|nr:Tropomyosin beta chain-like [Lasiodiplodia theobromae]KAF4545051.1 Tropomyosin beta chain-like [Lasiodiplodia theobromae]